MRFQMSGYRWGLALLMLFLASCARTKLTRVHDPDYQRTQFASAAVFADASDLQQRRLIEDVLARELSTGDLSVRSSIDLLPPTRDYTPEERARALLNAGVDAVIVVAGETGIERVYVPVSRSSTTTTGVVTVQNNAAYYKETARTEYQGGYTINKPWAEITTRVIDLRTARTAWLGQTDTRGGGFSTLDGVRKSYARSIAKQLQQDRIFAMGSVPNRAPLNPQADPGLGAAASAPLAQPGPPNVTMPKGAEPSTITTAPTTPPPASAPRSLVAQLEGCVIAGDDGQFLGRITSKPDVQSIRDAHGEYGGTSGGNSIFNPRGSYGSATSLRSAFNANATNPPAIFCGDQFRAFLSTNRQKTPVVDARLLAALLRSTPTSECTKDTDCDGDQVCETGRCGDARPALPDLKAFTGQAAPRPTPAVSGAKGGPSSAP